MGVDNRDGRRGRDRGIDGVAAAPKYCHPGLGSERVWRRDESSRRPGLGPAVWRRHAPPIGTAVPAALPARKTSVSPERELSQVYRASRQVCIACQSCHKDAARGVRAWRAPLISIREVWKIRHEERVSMSRLTLGSVVTIDPDVTFRELDGEIVILNLETGVYFGLDKVGARIWRLIEDHGSLGTVLSALRSEYDTTPAVLEHDLLELVGDLCAKGLTRVASPPA